MPFLGYFNSSFWRFFFVRISRFHFGVFFFGGRTSRQIDLSRFFGNDSFKRSIWSSWLTYGELRTWNWIVQWFEHVLTVSHYFSGTVVIDFERIFERSPFEEITVIQPTILWCGQSTLTFYRTSCLVLQELIFVVWVECSYLVRLRLLMVPKAHRSFCLTSMLNLACYLADVNWPSSQMWQRLAKPTKQYQSSVAFLWNLRNKGNYEPLRRRGVGPLWNSWALNM